MEKENQTRAFRIPVLLASFALFAGLSLYFYFHLLGRNPSSGQNKSIAVLPFANGTGDSANAYFCDGITEAVIAELNRISDLRVSPRTSTLYAFKKQGKDIRLTGKELHAGSILGGQVKQSGKKIIIEVNLVDIPSGKTIWTKKYDQDIKDLFSIQSGDGCLGGGKIKRHTY